MIDFKNSFDKILTFNMIYYNACLIFYYLIVNTLIYKKGDCRFFLYWNFIKDFFLVTMICKKIC